MSSDLSLKSELERSGQACEDNWAGRQRGSVSDDLQGHLRLKISKYKDACHFPGMLIDCGHRCAALCLLSQIS